jgi:FkbM family methyltransferase
MYLYGHDSHICRDLRAVGVWEPGVADAIEKHLRPEWTFLDLGAHVGSFSVMAQCKHAIAVEPSPDIFPVLARNAALHGFEAHNVAVTDVDGEVNMFLVDRGNTGGSWVEGKAHKNGAVEVQSRTLPTILQGRFPEFIKADIEGCEYRAFKDCPEVLEKARVIIVEYASEQLERSSGCTGKEFLDLLTSTGF